MTENLEALLTLKKTGTMRATATELRLTPSAVSKRIAFLEESLGYRLIEPQGRKVLLTASALRLCERLEPLLADLRSLLSEERGSEAGDVAIGISESLLASWGAHLLAAVSQELPQARLLINTHRSPVVIDRIRSGEYSLGICAGVASRLSDLKVEVLTEEPIVLIPSGLKPIRIGKEPLEVISIESHSATGEGLRTQMKKLSVPIKVTRELQSYSGIVQLAAAGLGHALAPEGIAKALGVPPKCRLTLPGEGLSRPISLVMRPSALGRGAVESVAETLRKKARDLKW